jgi:hypothetical protein
MKFWTWSEIRTKVERDLDLEGESFITGAELLGYANEAIDEVERQVLTLCEDYFITRSVLTLVPGQEEYSLPTDIYANKIRKIVYRNGSQVWPVKRIREWEKFSVYEESKIASIASGANYGFFVINSVPGAPKIVITPTPTEAGPYLQIWYLRNANELCLDTDVCDIPEAVHYVMAYMKAKCHEKDMNPNLGKAVADLEAQRSDTMKTLAEMFPDNENTLEADMSLYAELN